MKTDHLIRMANQIGDFFDAMPDRTEALDGVARHIQKFWEPRMRRQLLDAIDHGQAQDLREPARAAIESRRGWLQG